MGAFLAAEIQKLDAGQGARIARCFSCNPRLASRDGTYLCLPAPAARTRGKAPTISAIPDEAAVRHVSRTLIPTPVRNAPRGPRMPACAKRAPPSRVAPRAVSRCPREVARRRPWDRAVGICAQAGQSSPEDARGASAIHSGGETAPLLSASNPPTLCRPPSFPPSFLSCIPEACDDVLAQSSLPRLPCAPIQLRSRTYGALLQVHDPKAGGCRSRIVGIHPAYVSHSAWSPRLCAYPAPPAWYSRACALVAGSADRCDRQGAAAVRCGSHCARAILD